MEQLGEAVGCMPMADTRFSVCVVVYLCASEAMVEQQRRAQLGMVGCHDGSWTVVVGYLGSPKRKLLRNRGLGEDDTAEAGCRSSLKEALAEQRAMNVVG